MPYINFFWYPIFRDNWSVEHLFLILNTIVINSRNFAYNATIFTITFANDTLYLKIGKIIKCIFHSTQIQPNLNFRITIVSNKILRKNKILFIIYIMQHKRSRKIFSYIPRKIVNYAVCHQNDHKKIKESHRCAIFNCCSVDIDELVPILSGVYHSNSVLLKVIKHATGLHSCLNVPRKHHVKRNRKKTIQEIRSIQRNTKIHILWSFLRLCFILSNLNFSCANGSIVLN